MNPYYSKQFMKRKQKSQYIQYPLQSNRTKQINQAQFEQNIQLNKSQSKQKTSALKQKFNPFIALSGLKSAEEQFEMIKKRLQVLKLKDQKNNHRYELNQRKMLFHNSVQKLSDLQKQRLKQWKDQVQERRQQQRVINLHQKIIRNKNIEEISQKNHQLKHRQFQQRKSQAKSNEKKKLQMQKQFLENNKEKVQSVKKLETMSRISVQNYTTTKLKGYKEKKFKQANSLLDKKSQKQEEIKKMIEMQMQMVQRQSRSRVIFDKSTEKLKQLLNPETNLKNSKIKNSWSSRTKQEDKKYQDQQISQSKTQMNPQRQINILREMNKKASTQISKMGEVSTKQLSFSLQHRHNQFSLPSIKSARKYQ